MLLFLLLKNRINYYYKDSDNGSIVFAGFSNGTNSSGTINTAFVTILGDDYTHNMIKLEGSPFVDDSLFLLLYSPDVAGEEFRLRLSTTGVYPYEFDGFGMHPATPEASELAYNYMAIGVWNENLRSAYGTKVDNPLASGNADEYNFNIPARRLKGEFSFNANP